MKFLIRGLGSIGRRHLANLRALGQTDLAAYRVRAKALPEEEAAGLRGRIVEQQCPRLDGRCAERMAEAIMAVAGGPEG